MKRNRRFKTPLRVIPLGGLREIGKNLTVYEYGKDIIIVDTGLSFPEDELLGVDIVIPDINYLRNNVEKIRGVVYTHGHEDHIGGAPYFLKEINVPIYGAKLTLALIEEKLKQHNIKNVKMIEKKAGDKFKIGAFNVELINVNHSIPDSFAVSIKTKAASIIQTGDFKVDYSPVSGDIIDLQRFGELGKEGVDLLLSDSTNAQRQGHTMSESSVGETFDDLFRTIDGRIIIASFASNLFRIQQVFNSCRNYNKKIAFTGRSMNKLTKIGIELGYLQIPSEEIIDIKDINKYPDNEVVILTTGSQGEPMAGLTRMSQKSHNQISLKEGDTVILSSSPIPGNEKSVSQIINSLTEMEVNVIYESLADVHVSGHACSEELKLMLALVRPKHFLPVHGELTMLKRHKELAMSLGVLEENAYILSNGDVLEVLNGKVKQAKSVEAGRVLIDGLSVGDISHGVLKERKQLGEDGLIIAFVKTDKQIDIITRGFIHIRESEELIAKIKERLTKKIENLDIMNKSDWNSIKRKIKEVINRVIYEIYKTRPMVLVFIQEV